MNMMSAATDSLKSNCSSSSRTDLLRQYATTESSGQDGTELMKKEATTLTEYMKYITNELKVLDNPKPQCSHTHTDENADAKHIPNHRCTIYIYVHPRLLCGWFALNLSIC